MKLLRELLKEMDELSCAECGADLKSKGEFETGVCSNCSDEEECEYMEYYTDAKGTVLTEGAVRMFKKMGKKLIRKYRCTSGPKKGQPVSDPSKCAQRKDPKKVRQQRKNMRRGKASRKRKSKITRKTSLSRMARNLNKNLKGNTSKKKSTTLKPSSTKFTKVTNASTSTVKTKVLSKATKTKKSSK